MYSIQLLIVEGQGWHDISAVHRQHADTFPDPTNEKSMGAGACPAPLRAETTGCVAPLV
jgi:hypothetical protein